MSLFQYRSFSRKSILVLKEKSSVAEQGAAQKQNSSEAKQFRSETYYRSKLVQKQK